MLKAFHNKISIKNKYVARVKKHYKADEIIQGVYWENGKGCAVGCTLEYSNDGNQGNVHYLMEDQLGIPLILARLEDGVFEGLAKEDAKKFPLDFLEAIRVGADLSLVWPKFIVWLLIDKKDGVIQYARPEGKKAIQAVADLYKRVIEGEKVDTEEWLLKKQATYNAYYADGVDAAYYAADAAYYAAAATYYAAVADAATYYAAATAAATYYAAVATAYYAADYAAAKKVYYRKMAEKLIELLKEAE